MRRLLVTAAVLACALQGAASARAAAVEVRSAAGALVASGTSGSFSFPADGSVVQVGSTTLTPQGVELRDVTILGGEAFAARVLIPSNRRATAHVQGLVAAGRSVPDRPNTLVPLGGRSYLVVRQEARAGSQLGLVGLRVYLGEPAPDVPAGTQVLLGLAVAAHSTRQPVLAHQRQPSLVLGFTSAPQPTASEFVDEPVFGSGGPTGTKAVALAEQFLGVPYVWGGASPSGFDCSGLVMYVYARLGVSLPHFSGYQWGSGPHVPADQLAPGDIVFFDPGPSGPGHEGLYIGGGQFIQAPHTGDVVKISSLSEAGYGLSYVGAVRPYASQIP
ncbi:MAG: peptidoglycan DL-endopeptidase CwlO [Gaiellaceae bacterium]|nr:peptidoglycan DL-endopeptidase CwlO [Gaiellaceae bacterium]